MSIAEKLMTVAENQQEIGAQYFRTSFMGNGETGVSFAVPFMPDVLEIVALSPYAVSRENSYYTVVIDTRTAQKWGGVITFFIRTEAGGVEPQVAPFKATTLHDGRISHENGVLTCNINSIWTFAPNVRYYVVATRFPNTTTKKMVEEEIALLPDVVPEGSNGRLLYSQSRINATFTTAEWNALKATKPNWTFVLD